jgi:hypothetical protein
MWWPCLLIDRDEMSNLHRGHPIDASYQVSGVVLAYGRTCPRDELSGNRFWQGELLPSLGVRRPLTFHILIFSSKTPYPNELKLGCGGHVC